MASCLAVTLGQVTPPDQFRGEVKQNGMVKSITDPRKERVHLEECVLLAKLVQLWISVKKTSRNELIKDAHSKRREDGKEDIVERQCPRFVNHLSGECVLEGVLKLLVKPIPSAKELPYPELSHVQCDVLVERIQNDFADSLVTPSSMHEKKFP